MRAFSKVLYIEDVHLGTSGFLLLGGGGKEGLEDLGGVEGGSVVVNRVQGGRDCQVTAYEGVGEGGGGN